jgi:hypothetical protein
MLCLTEARRVRRRSAMEFTFSPAPTAICPTLSITVFQICRNAMLGSLNIAKRPQIRGSFTSWLTILKEFWDGGKCSRCLAGSAARWLGEACGMVGFRDRYRSALEDMLGEHRRSRRGGSALPIAVRSTESSLAATLVQASKLHPEESIGPSDALSNFGPLADGRVQKTLAMSGGGRTDVGGLSRRRRGR